MKGTSMKRSSLRLAIALYLLAPIAPARAGTTLCSGTLGAVVVNRARQEEVAP